MKSATAHDPGVAHRVHDPANVAGVYSTRVRKPKRRAMASTNPPRSRTRSSDPRDRSSRDPTPADVRNPFNSRSDDSSPPPSTAPLNSKDKSSSPDSQRTKPTSNNDPKPQSDTNPSWTLPPAVVQPALPRELAPDVWCRDDLIAIAADIREKDTIDPDKLFGGSDAALPQQLKRKTRADLSTALSSIKEFLNEADDEDAPKCTVDSVLAALASEMYFMDTQKKKRDSAIDSLRKARSERLKVESYSSKLIAESKALSEQVARERTRRGKATEEKADSEKRLEQERKKLEAERSNYSIVRENMEKAKMSELDVRRRLDRMRLKVAAMRGEMVISTVDKLANPSPIWLGDTDESIISIDTDPKANRAEDTSQPAKGEEKQDVDMTEAQSGIESSTPSGSRDELELDEGQEETEFRLLKNRLAMCEMEAEEWRTTLDAEREKVRLILRAKTRLEEEFVRQKQGGINKSGGSGGRSVGKGAASNIRPAAKLRAAVRATIPCPPDIGARKAVRRSRKGRPRKALVGASN